MKRLLIFVICLAALLGQSFAQLVPPLTAECATSIDGSVLGVPNPLAPPIVAAAYTGTLGAGNYFVEIVWYDAAAHVTLASPEVAIQLSGTGEIQVSPPSSGMPATAVGTQVFIGTASGGETLQGSVVGSGTYTQSVPLTTGAALPTTNTTLCMVIANDAGWPSGTGYVVGLTSPSGDTYPGYPMQWQLLGPGNTVNLSEGLPLYNGTVTYPIPILARPYNHGPQSISGPLSMTGYNLTQVGNLGVGTALPAWGVDVKGSATQGAVNAKTGYLFNGLAPSNHILLGNGDYYVDSATFPYASLSGAPFLPGVGGTPTIAAGAGAGTSPTVSLLTGSADYAGVVNVLTGSSPTASAVVATTTFGTPFPTFGFCVISATGGDGVFVKASGDRFNLIITAGGTGLTATTLYQWSYLCNGY